MGMRDDIAAYDGIEGNEGIDMTGQRESQNRDSGRALWRLYKKNRVAPPSGESSPDPLELAAYLDDKLGESDRSILELQCADNPQMGELLVAARLAHNKDEDAPEHILVRAAALVPDSVTPEGAGFVTWLRAVMGVPWRPAIAASAIGVYALLCVASFGLGVGIGLPGDVETALEDPGVERELFGNNDDWM